MSATLQATRLARCNACATIPWRIDLNRIYEQRTNDSKCPGKDMVTRYRYTRTPLQPRFWTASQPYRPAPKKWICSLVGTVMKNRSFGAMFWNVVEHNCKRTSLTGSYLSQSNLVVQLAKYHEQVSNFRSVTFVIAGSMLTCRL